MADIAANARRGKNAPPISPIAWEAVKRIDALFDIEREIIGLIAEERLRARRKESAALVAGLEDWMRAERAKLSRHAAVAKAIDYMLTRWGAFTRFLHDGRICLTNNAAERALRGLALGRKSWLFAGSERGAERAALMYTLIQTAKLNNVDPQAWLADVLAGIADTPQTRSPGCYHGIGGPIPCTERPRSRGLRRRVTPKIGQDVCTVAGHGGGRVQENERGTQRRRLPCHPQRPEQVTPDNIWNGAVTVMRK